MYLHERLFQDFAPKKGRQWQARILFMDHNTTTTFFDIAYIEGRKGLQVYCEVNSLFGCLLLSTKNNIYMNWPCAELRRIFALHQDIHQQPFYNEWYAIDKAWCATALLWLLQGHMLTAYLCSEHRYRFRAFLSCMYEDYLRPSSPRKNKIHLLQLNVACGINHACSQIHSWEYLSRVHPARTCLLWKKHFKSLCLKMDCRKIETNGNCNLTSHFRVRV